MKKISIFILATCFSLVLKAQNDSMGVVTVQKDERIDILGSKMAEYNKNLAIKPRSTKGYRLMLLSTSDRNLAMQVRTKLLQQFPSQAVYMSFQSPYIKLKFGNFEDRAEAERFRKAILSKKMVPGNVYITADNIELKPKEEEEED
ncbi:MAG: SPOR domain-containing protein [Ferruginibacter sp.]